MGKCCLCPRNCLVDRPLTKTAKGTLGFCQMAQQPVVARAGLHFWEEPCLSGVRGSGTIFFTGCNLRCVYCQNYELSYEHKGREISLEQLQSLYTKLVSQGAHNINLVTPTHFVETIAASLATPLPVPVVYNTGGYESLESLTLLKGKVQIYLPDLKYASSAAGSRYSKAPDYFQVATKAISAMYEQVGPYQLDQDGMLQKGVLVRHLILPGQVENSKKIIDWIEENFSSGQILFSLMHQYIPCGQAAKYPEINRKLTQEEYQEVEEYLFASGIEDGFVQEEGAADSEFIPDFDGTGLEDL